MMIEGDVFVRLSSGFLSDNSHFKKQRAVSCAGVKCILKPPKKYRVDLYLDLTHCFIPIITEGAPLAVPTLVPSVWREGSFMDESSHTNVSRP